MDNWINNKFQEYADSVEELKKHNLLSKIMVDYLKIRNVAQIANHKYRNATEYTQPLMSDQEYDKMLHLLEKMEKDFPYIKDAADQLLGVKSPTERIE